MMELKNTRVGIIGCGWLGTALAKRLQGKKYAVLTTRTSIANAQLMTEQGIDCQVLTLPSEQGILNEHAIFEQQVIIIAITPQFRRGREDYAEKVQQLATAINKSNSVKKVILLSSTAVYNGLTGIVDENSSLDLTADKVEIINQAEQAVLSLQSSAINCKSYVLRLSGLLGPDRHPGKFLRHGRTLKDANAWVNLIHQADAVGLLMQLMNSDVDSGIFNGVSATKMKKAEYYQSAAKALSLPQPQFAQALSERENDSKQVSSEKSRELLKYHYQYDDLHAWLSTSI